MRINFQEVTRHGERSGKCSVCGKRGKQSRAFTQTINPWNKNTKGEPKSYQEIYDELTTERDEWQSKPFIHARCV